MRIKKPESYVEKDGRLYYIGNTDGSPEELLKLIIGQTKIACG
jgi:hypothetical protein